MNLHFSWLAWMVSGAFAYRFTLPLTFALWRVVTLPFRRPITAAQLQKMESMTRAS